MSDRLVTGNRDYLLIDRSLKIRKFSLSCKQYAESPQFMDIDRDVRLSIPEIVGLENVIDLIFQQKSDNFVLNGINRDREDRSLIYFNIFLEKLEDKLIILFDNVTELMELRQFLEQKINESELALDTLKRFKYCTNRIIDSMGEILLIVDSSGRIEKINRAAEIIFGYAHKELINCQIDTIVYSKSFDYFEIYKELLNKNNASFKKLELTCQNKAGNNLIEIEFDCFLVPTEIKKIFSCVCIGRDITARKKAELEMLESLEKEKKLKELKSSFISMASHEFKNPLSSILLCVDALKTENEELLSDTSEFYLQSIAESASNMQSLLEDILILSKTEDGKQKLNFIDLNIIEFCQKIIGEINLSFPKRKINFISKDESIIFFGNKQILWHILTNLLSNALKYSPSDKDVDLSVEDRENEIIIEIRDRGIGIPPRTQKNLFESFYRGSNVGDIPGTGLGLAIVKTAVELHQGTITLDSELDRGTSVKIKIPQKSFNSNFS